MLIKVTRTTTKAGHATENPSCLAQTTCQKRSLMFAGISLARLRHRSLAVSCPATAMDVFFVIDSNTLQTRMLIFDCLTALNSSDGTRSMTTSSRSPSSRRTRNLQCPSSFFSIVPGYQMLSSCLTSRRIPTSNLAPSILTGAALSDLSHCFACDSSPVPLSSTGPTWWVGG